MANPVPQDRKSSPQRRVIKTKGLLVLGMHRSGTSACTRVLNLLGCALPEDLIGADEGNVRGHWESTAVMQFNERMLASAGSRWEDWGPINVDWRESELRNDMVYRAAEIVADHITLGPLFAIKDPRTCRLADIWFDAMDQAGVEPHAILMVRNPAEVAASLESRDLMKPGYAHLLWLRHVLDAEHYSRGRKRIVLRYDQLITDWHALVVRLKDTLSIALPRNSPAAHAEIEEFLDESLRHHAIGSNVGSGKIALPDAVRRSFAIMAAWSEQGENPADHAELDDIRRQFDQSYKAFARLLLPGSQSEEAGTGPHLRRELAGLADERTVLLAEIERNTAQAAKYQAEIAGLQTEQARLTEVAAEAEALRAQVAASMHAQAQEQDQRLHAEHVLASTTETLHALQLQSAEQSGKLIGLESALVQRQEELTQLWRQLLDTEKSSAVAATEAAALEARLVEAHSALAKAQSDLEQKSEQPAASPPAADKMHAEIAALTRLLQEQEQATRTADTACAAAERHLAAAQEQINDLTRLLQAQEQATLAADIARAAAERQLEADKDQIGDLTRQLQDQQRAAQSAESARSTTERKLAARFDEVARLTSLLAEEASRASDAEANAHWLRQTVALAQSFPKWWSLMPTAWRRTREHRRYARSGLFNVRKYLEIYPDVAEDGMDPVRHYMLHGLAEGRQRPT